MQLLIKFTGLFTLLCTVFTAQAQHADALNQKSCAMMCHVPEASETLSWDESAIGHPFVDLGAHTLLAHAITDMKKIKEHPSYDFHKSTLFHS